MKVNVLEQFLRSLSAPLAAVGAASSVDAVCAALAPFAEAELDAFAHFLRQADEFRIAGKVVMPDADGMALESLQQSYRSVMEQMDHGDATAIAQRQEQAKAALASLAKQMGLTGTLKVDAKFAAALLAERDMESRVQQVRELAALIEVGKSFQQMEVQLRLGELVNVPLKELKDVAKRLGIKATGAKTPTFLNDLLAKMTGIACNVLDLAAVMTHVQRLKELYETSIDSLPEAEIAEEMKQLKELPIAELTRVAEEFGVENPGKTKPAIMKRIESKLTATFKARRANQV